MIVRKYRPSDANTVVCLWLRNYCDSRYGHERGAHVEGSKQRDEFWAEQERVVHALIEACGVDILADDEDDDVILAFACQDAKRVHFAVAKKRFAAMRGTMLSLLLGEALQQPRVVTHEIRDIRAAGLQPTWRYDPSAIAPAIIEGLLK